MGLIVCAVPPGPARAPSARVQPAQAREYSEREHSLRAQMFTLQETAEAEAASHSTELAKLQESLGQLKRTMLAEEVQRMNAVDDARDIMAPELLALQR